MVPRSRSAASDKRDRAVGHVGERVHIAHAVVAVEAQIAVVVEHVLRRRQRRRVARPGATRDLVRVADPVGVFAMSTQSICPSPSLSSRFATRGVDMSSRVGPAERLDTVGHAVTIAVVFRPVADLVAVGADRQRLGIQHMARAPDLASVAVRDQRVALAGVLAPIAVGLPVRQPVAVAATSPKVGPICAATPVA